MEKFIVFEGICCSGKTTAADNLRENYKAVYGKAAFSETHLGKLYKESFQNKLNFSDSFYISDVIAQTRDFIIPAIENNKKVIMDRYTDSIIAYSNACCRLIGEKGYNIKYQMEYLERNGIVVKPQKYFYFQAKKEIIIQRLSLISTRIHKFYLENPLLINFVIEEFENIIAIRRKQGIEVIKVKTDEYNIQETYLYIKKQLDYES